MQNPYGSSSSRERVIQALNQLHSGVEKLPVRESLPCPTLEYFVDAISFFAAEFSVREIRIVNSLGNHVDFSVANLELFLQGLERAVVAAMPEASLVEHVERHRLGRHSIFGRKCKARFGINEAPNQPGRCRAVDAGPRAGHPNPALVVSRTDRRGFRFMRRHTRRIGTRQQLRHTLLQRTTKKIDLDNLLKTTPQTAEATHGLLLRWQGRKPLQFPKQFLIFASTRFRKACN